MGLIPLQYPADEIRFDVEKEERVSVEDSRQLMCIDVDAVGSGYRMIFNGCEFMLPDGIKTIEEARKVALEMAIREAAAALTEIINKHFD